MKPVLFEFMPHSWKLDHPDMRPVLRKHVQGREVLDLGGGDGSFAHVLVKECGAKHVTVVEKDPRWQSGPLHRVDRVSFAWEFVHEYRQRAPHGRWDVVTLSWPINIEGFCYHARKIAELAQRVIVVGKNDGCTAIGTSVLWKHLVLRERVDLIETPVEDLIVYGPRERDHKQDLCGTEHHGVRYDLCLTT